MDKLRELIANLDIESAQLAKSKTAVGQAGATWLSRVARELKALLPSLESALEERSAERQADRSLEQVLRRHIASERSTAEMYQRQGLISEEQFELGMIAGLERAIEVLRNSHGAPAAPTERLRGLREIHLNTIREVLEHYMPGTGCDDAVFEREAAISHCEGILADHEAQQAEGKPTEGDSAREVAEQIVKPYMSAGAFAIDCATQLIELYTQRAVAQARVDLLIEARRVLGTGTDNFRRWLDARKFAEERDLAAIASGKEPVK